MHKKLMNPIESEILLTRIINETIKLEELTQEQLVFSISNLAKMYKKCIVDAGKASYNNDLQTMKNELEACKFKIKESNEKIKSLAGKMSRPLTLSERIKGRMDLKKLTTGS